MTYDPDNKHDYRALLSFIVAILVILAIGLFTGLK